MNHFVLSVLALAAAAMPLPLSGEPITTEEIKNGYKKHAALTQFHRWFLLYENPEYGIENQLDILTRDISLSSGLGEAEGHAGYRQRVERLPSSWKNAHTVDSTQITVGEDGRVNLLGKVTYLDQGLLKHDAVRMAELSYATELISSDTALPQFKSIAIDQESESTVEKFVPAYAQNRVLSLVHYWLTLIEDPSRNAEPVKEILADSFSLNFSSGAITDFGGFEAWLAGPGSAVSASTHRIDHFEVLETATNEMQAKMTFDRNGILPDGTEMTAKTHHTWQVVDSPSERFARIKGIDVKVLEPFAPKAE